MTNARARAGAVLVALLAAALLLLPLGEGMLSDVLHVLGWIIAALALVTFLVPKILRRFILQIIDAVESSIPNAIIRVLGLVAIAAGLALIYVGVYIV
jgi:uncharacterized protein YjeT (DUF2065 family)